MLVNIPYMEHMGITIILTKNAHRPHHLFLGGDNDGTVSSAQRAAAGVVLMSWKTTEKRGGNGLEATKVKCIVTNLISIRTFFHGAGYVCIESANCGTCWYCEPF